MNDRKEKKQPKKTSFTITWKPHREKKNQVNNCSVLVIKIAENWSKTMLDISLSNLSMAVM